MKTAWLGSIVLWAGLAASPVAAEETSTAEMYKPLQCGCCDEYARYLEENGIKVQLESLPDKQFIMIKRMAVVPESVWGCHTLKIGDYVVEGLVPIDAINKLLAEKPQIRGISVPGMPVGAPGMGGQNASELTVYVIPQDSADPPQEFARD